MKENTHLWPKRQDVSLRTVLLIPVLLRLEPLLLLVTSPFQHVEWLGSWLKCWCWCVVIVAVFVVLVEVKLS